MNGTRRSRIGFRAPGVPEAALALAITLAAGIPAAACRERAPQAEEEAPPPSPEEEAPPPSPASITVSDVGFATPESVLHDEAADLYLVSNINGTPLEKDDNGFISRVGSDGAVLALRWIDGAREDVELHAPKGMAVKGDTLFVTDIDVVRLFHRETGAPLGSRAVPGARFLNDLAVGPDGTVYVTDSDARTGALYRFGAAGEAEALAKGAELGGPNGIVADPAGVVVVTLGSGEVYRIDAAGARTDLPKPPAGRLDGVVRLADGSLLVSSWEGSAVYHYMAGGMGGEVAGGRYMSVVENVESPADIGYDAVRGRVLIPVFNRDRVQIREVR